MNTPSISDILDRMTDADREALLNGKCAAPHPVSYCICAADYDRLIDLGLAEPVKGLGIVRTPLGLEVQSALREASEGNRS